MLGSILAWIVGGGIAGWLASVVVRGTGIGIVGDVLVGIIGAVIGGIMFSLIGDTGAIGFDVWSVVVAVIGAVVLLLLLRLLGINTRGPTRP
ncbi:MAG TPA: GlsB/YeaQ/YmgE family stress response membrane protein [Ktedonobacterales bacterium]|nr:GlsB/YeaQ/YmgE family stress response membrane protein [Ktedonobacterales bacterium]